MARTADELRTVSLDDRRVPPQNLEAEESVLGSMMLSAEAIADVVEILDIEDFYRSANAKIYSTLRGLYARGEPVDIITGVEALRADGLLDEVGGPLYLRDLVDQVPTPASAGHYAQIVARSALRRRLISAAADIMDLAYASTEDADVVADSAEQRIYDVARREDHEDVAVLRELVNQAMVDLESIQNRDSAFTGLPTGFVDLDNLMSGLQPGNLIV
ncbi:MAG TPA: DnaB-like helicase N-terminal domain-containing protein, partial [Actinomycetota bacterium]|nr:DnaB-like helicase N-terminal domain-containing protein [Actinomycetota bacterium]